MLSYSLEKLCNTSDMNAIQVFGMYILFTYILIANTMTCTENGIYEHE